MVINYQINSSSYRKKFENEFNSCFIYNIFRFQSFFINPIDTQWILLNLVFKQKRNNNVILFYVNISVEKRAVYWSVSSLYYAKMTTNIYSLVGFLKALQNQKLV